VGLSIGAMIFRAHQLESVNTAQYRRWTKNISRREWRSGVQEPSEPERPAPELLPAAAAHYFELAQVTPDEAAQQMGWSAELFSDITSVQQQPEIAEPGVQLHSLEEYRAKRARGG